jgi:hypothetical protein
LVQIIVGALLIAYCYLRRRYPRVAEALAQALEQGQSAKVKECDAHFHAKRVN